jgi:probable HAF family extracellular repeat protein
MKLQAACKSRMFTNIIAMTLFAAMAMPVCVLAQGNAAQEQKEEKHEHHHYKLIDMGTLGGPNSFPPSPGTLDINSRGLPIAEADTPIPDPFAPICLQSTCLVNHAITWQNGVQTDLGALPGANNSSIAGWINDQGTVVGLSNNSLIDPLTGFPEFRAVLWTGGKIHDLGTLGGNVSFASAINNRGQVVGGALNKIPDSAATGLTFAGTPVSFYPVATQYRAVLWQDGVIHDLGTLGRGNDAAAFFLNNRGQVAGVSFTDTILNASGVPTQDPFFWENGKMVDIGNFGGTSGEPRWMNNRGQVVGFSTVAGDQNSHAFLWDKKDGLKDLGLLPGGLFGGANWINDAGEIVGGSDGGTFFHAVLWKNGAVIDLGTVANDTCSSALSINSQGQIVGFGSADCNVEDHAFLWENGGPMVDLQTLVLPESNITLTTPVVINDRGEIVSYGNLPNGDFRSVLLIPCDENHAGVEDCDFDTVDAETAASVVRPAQIARASAAASAAKLSSAEMMTRFRSMNAGRNRRFGTPQTSPK